MATKRYIIENRSTKLLRTDSLAKASKKATELQAANEPWFKITDTQTGTIDTYQKQPGQQNYRNQLSQLPKN
jgi:hypothetical protein